MFSVEFKYRWPVCQSRRKSVKSVTETEKKRKNKKEQVNRDSGLAVRVKRFPGDARVYEIVFRFRNGRRETRFFFYWLQSLDDSNCRENKRKEKKTRDAIGLLFESCSAVLRYGTQIYKF